MRGVKGPSYHTHSPAKLHQWPCIVATRQMRHKSTPLPGKPDQWISDLSRFVSGLQRTSPSSALEREHQRSKKSKYGSTSMLPKSPILRPPGQRNHASPSTLRRGRGALRAAHGMHMQTRHDMRHEPSPLPVACSNASQHPPRRSCLASANSRTTGSGYPAAKAVPWAFTPGQPCHASDPKTPRDRHV